MDTEIQALPENVDDLQRLLRELIATTAALRSDVATKDGVLEVTLRELASEREENLRLREQVRLYLQKKFGSSSEKLSKDQLQIFNEAELLGEPDKPEDEEETSADESSADNSATNDPARPRRKKGRRPLPQSLPRREVIHDLAPEEKICPHDGHELRRIGEEVSEQLEYIPGTVEVIRNIRPKYACPSCEECVRIGPLPPQPIPKSMAAPGLLAQIAVAKYCDALPLYRQSNIFERVGIDLSRTTMANWMIQLGDLVQPVINLLRDELLDGDLVQCDETSCQVLKEPGKAAQTLSYLWVQRGGSGETPIILFDYDRSRSSEVPKRLLEEFKGFLQTDGYKGYDAVVVESRGLIVRVGCMAHVRRKFDEAIKAQSGGKKSQKEKRGATKAHQGFAFVQKLYRIETKIRGQSAEVRRSVRQAEAIPILEEMKEWLDETKQQVTTAQSHRNGDQLHPPSMGVAQPVRQRWTSRNRQQRSRERDPSLRSGTEELVVCRHGARGRGECQPLQPDRDRQSERTRAVPIPSSSLCRATESRHGRRDRATATDSMEAPGVSLRKRHVVH